MGPAGLGIAAGFTVAGRRRCSPRMTAHKIAHKTAHKNSHALVPVMTARRRRARLGGLFLAAFGGRLR